MTRPVLADTAQPSIVAITGSGEATNLHRCLARMNGTTCSWRGTPKPPSTRTVEQIAQSYRAISETWLMRGREPVGADM